MERRRIVLVLVAALAGGCGGSPAVPAVATGSETEIVRIQDVVGMPSPRPAQPPSFTVYGDGRVLKSGPNVGALQTLTEHRVPAELVNRIHRRAHAAGLARNATYADPDVIDGQLLISVLTSGDRRYVVRATPPGGKHRDEVRRLQSFRTWAERLDLPRPATEYRPERLAVVAWAGSTATPGAGDDVRDWPYADLASGSRIQEGLCLILSGADLAGAAELARQAQRNTRWRSGDTTFHVIFRPMLPAERTCADLVPS